MSSELRSEEKNRKPLKEVLEAFYANVIKCASKVPSNDCGGSYYSIYCSPRDKYKHIGAITIGVGMILGKYFAYSDSHDENVVVPMQQYFELLNQTLSNWMDRGGGFVMPQAPKNLISLVPDFSDTIRDIQVLITKAVKN